MADDNRDSDREEVPEDNQPYQRFKIVKEDECFKFQLTDAMLEFVKENFENFIPDKDIKDSVLKENPRPENCNHSKKLDDYLADIMREKKCSKELAFEATLEKVQEKTLDIMGPLTRLWLAVEEITSHKGEEEPPKFSIGEAQWLIEQTVVLLGQSYNFITYERRKNTLGCVMNPNQVASNIKEKADLLSKSGPALFGNEYRDSLVDSSKAKRKSLEVFTNSYAPPAKKPFREGPSFPSSNKRFRRGYEGQFSSNKNFNNNYRGGRGFQRGNGCRSLLAFREDVNKVKVNTQCDVARKASMRIYIRNKVDTTSAFWDESFSETIKSMFVKLDGTGIILETRKLKGTLLRVQYACNDQSTACDIIKIGGENDYPFDLEMAITSNMTTSIPSLSSIPVEITPFVEVVQSTEITSTTPTLTLSVDMTTQIQQKPTTMVVLVISIIVALAVILLSIGVIVAFRKKRVYKKKQTNAANHAPQLPVSKTETNPPEVMYECVDHKQVGNSAEYEISYEELAVLQPRKNDLTLSSYSTLNVKGIQRMDDSYTTLTTTVIIANDVTKTSF